MSLTPRLQTSAHNSNSYEWGRGAMVENRRMKVVKNRNGSSCRPRLYLVEKPECRICWILQSSFYRGLFPSLLLSWHRWEYLPTFLLRHAQPHFPLRLRICFEAQTTTAVSIPSTAPLSRCSSASVSPFSSLLSPYPPLSFLFPNPNLKLNL
ncbi:hypothetical protein GYMLUDRAFT_596491 [Collybiopsis luxurians FD-317 M1]|uniref:Uncharacterized protein n=1 Tax=Collybiopsis luxurians FD-317 M1 TaxID=944289 RepID=A0A0D0CPL6_9AGAR|nr:hypothetical protein GYMLUDRAFT_596491 [Collybiopsis luxurians FD-317 M1]